MTNTLYFVLDYCPFQRKESMQQTDKNCLKYNIHVQLNFAGHQLLQNTLFLHTIFLFLKYRSLVMVEVAFM